MAPEFLKDAFNWYTDYEVDLYFEIVPRHSSPN
jgi:hypothetical protein